MVEICNISTGLCTAFTIAGTIAMVHVSVVLWFEGNVDVIMLVALVKLCQMDRKAPLHFRCPQMAVSFYYKNYKLFLLSYHKKILFQSVKPSPAISYNITNVLASYAFIMRYFNGEVDAVEATIYLLDICCNLSKNVNFDDAEIAIETVAQRCLLVWVNFQFKIFRSI